MAKAKAQETQEIETAAEEMSSGNEVTFDSFTGELMGNNAPFWKVFKDATIIGVITRHFTRTKDDGAGPKSVTGCDLKLSAPTYVSVSGDPDAKQLVQKGEIVRIDTVSGLAPLAESPVGLQVAIKCLGKVKNRRGQQMWQYLIKANNPAGK